MSLIVAFSCWPKRIPVSETLEAATIRKMYTEGISVSSSIHKDNNKKQEEGVLHLHMPMRLQSSITFSHSQERILRRDDNSFLVTDMIDTHGEIAKISLDGHDTCV